MANVFEECLKEEKKMIAFLADKIWDIMITPELYDRFTDRERDTVNTIRNHFDDADRYALDETDKEWNKTL